MIIPADGNVDLGFNYFLGYASMLPAFNSEGNCQSLFKC